MNRKIVLTSNGELPFRRDNNGNRVCSIPNCKNIAASRGKNRLDGSIKRFAWCKHHKKMGKDERKKIIASV